MESSIALASSTGYKRHQTEQDDDGISEKSSFSNDINNCKPNKKQKTGRNDANYSNAPIASEQNGVHHQTNTNIKDTSPLLHTNVKNKRQRSDEENTQNTENKNNDQGKNKKGKQLNDFENHITLPGPSNINTTNNSEEKINKGTSSKQANQFGSNNLKRKTSPGDYYQRVLQVLMRHRGSQFKRFEMAIEAPNVGDLDDIVCLDPLKNTCRFVQVKYSAVNRSVTISHMFKEKKKPKIETEKSNKPKKPKKYKPQFEILQYFPSFCTIKDLKEFENTEIEEITLLTNRKILYNTLEYKKYLKLENLENDRYLNLKKCRNEEEAEKFSLVVGLVKEKYNIYLKETFSDNLKHKLDIADQIIDEFLRKIRIVINYPSSKELEEIVMHEIFTDEFMDCHKLLWHSIIHSEFILLLCKYDRKDSDDWKSTINSIKEEINMYKAIGITEHWKEKLSQDVSCVEFDNINEMYEEVKIFLEDTEKRVLLYCNVENVKMNVVKVINILSQMPHSKQKLKLVHRRVENLLRNDYVVNAFLSNDFDFRLLILTSQKKNLDKTIMQDLQTKLTELKEAIKSSNKRIIFISKGENDFSAMLEAGINSLCKAGNSYRHSFENLKKSSQNIIMEKKIDFQGHEVSVKELFNNDVEFANTVIDESSLWDILDKSNPCSLSDEESFTSQEYDDTCYISRKLYKNIVDFTKVKKHLKRDLFFITGCYDMKPEDIFNNLIKGDIYSHTQRFKKGDKPRRTGIILNYSDISDNTLYFKTLIKQKSSKKSVFNVHWLILDNKGILYLVDSKNDRKTSEREFLAPKTPIEEKDYTNLGGSNETFILVGDSGEGKSTIITRMANIFKEKNRSVWITRSNLRRFFNKYSLQYFRSSLSDTETALKAVLKMALPFGSTIFEKNILKHGLEKSQKSNFGFILLLDGFNEIDETLQTETCKFINSLRETCNVQQIWVTTQIQDKVKLEYELKVPAYFLNTLEIAEQEQLMAKYWAKLLIQKHIHFDTLLQDAHKMLNDWKESISDEEEKRFTEVPLNLKMLANVRKDNRNIDTNISVSNLYEKFVEDKFSICHRETTEGNYWQNRITRSKNKRRSQMSSQIVDITKEKLFRCIVHEILEEKSAVIIMKKQLVKKPKRPKQTMFEKYVGKANCRSVLLKIGLLTERERGELEFIHDSFAQYFFSEYIKKNLNSPVIKTFFLNEVFKNSSLRLCRIFFNKILESKELQLDSNPPLESNESEPDLESCKLILDSNDIEIILARDDYFCAVMQDNLKALLQFILTNMKLRDDKLKKFLHKFIFKYFDNLENKSFSSEIIEAKQNLLKLPWSKIAGMFTKINNETNGDIFEAIPEPRKTLIARKILQMALEKKY